MPGNRSDDDEKVLGRECAGAGRASGSLPDRRISDEDHCKSVSFDGQSTKPSGLLKQAFFLSRHVWLPVMGLWASDRTQPQLRTDITVVEGEVPVESLIGEARSLHLPTASELRLPGLMSSG